MSSRFRKTVLAVGLLAAASAVWRWAGRWEPRRFDDLRQTVLERSGRSLAGLDLRDGADVLRTATFDTRTRWPAAARMPSVFDPARTLEVGKDPGLGIRSLHAQGITGKGVRVAIIDQPLLLDHEEYAGKIEQYTAIDCAGVRPSMHGPAVTSLLVGERCGVAPGASLLFWAELAGKGDHAHRMEALRQIIAFNAEKPLEERIRVVSVSIGFRTDFANHAGWAEALRDAEESGLIVVHCGARIGGIRCPIESDREVPANYTTCNYQERAGGRSHEGLIYAPSDNRTTASYEGKADYIFWGEGGPKSGLSWVAPYLAGVIALGLQVNPNLSAETVWRLLRETGDPWDRGVIVSPPGFVERARTSK